MHCNQLLISINRGEYERAYWNLDVAELAVNAVDGIRIASDNRTHMIYDELTDEQVLKFYEGIRAEDRLCFLYSRASFVDGVIRYPKVADMRCLEVYKKDKGIIEKLKSGKAKPSERLKQSPLLYRLFVEKFLKECLHAASSLNGGSLTGELNQERDITKYLQDQGLTLSDTFMEDYDVRQ